MNYYLFSKAKIVILSILLGMLLSRSSPIIMKENIVNKLPEVLNGDLVFRRSESMGSRFVDSLDDEGSYSHVGLVYIGPEGEAFVIHVLPSEGDVVQMEPLQSFVEDAMSFSLYRPIDIPASIVNKAPHIALHWIHTQYFDRKFDLSTDSHLYCTELIYKAYKKAGVDIVGGEFDKVEFPFLSVKEVIFPSSIIESGYFKLYYSSE